MGQVQAVRAGAESLEWPRLEQMNERAGPADRDTREQERGRRAERQVDPDEVPHGPHRALRAPRSPRRARPRRGRASATGADAVVVRGDENPGGDDAGREQRGELRRQTHEHVDDAPRAGRRAAVATTIAVIEASTTAAPHRRRTKRSSGKRMYSCASIAIDQNAPLGLGEPKMSWTQESVDHHGLRRRLGLRLGDHPPSDGQAEGERRPVRRQDPPRASPCELADASKLPPRS